MAKPAVAERPGSAAKKPGPAGMSAGEGAPASMSAADLKRILRLAQAEPVNAAFALGSDGKAVVLLDRRKPSRALGKTLKDDVPNSTNHRFGTASVDEINPKLVRFWVNKAAGGGMARKLVIALKGTGYRMVEIGCDDGPVESAETDEPEEAGAAVQPANGTGAAENPPPVTGQLVARLTQFVKQMLDVTANDPAQRGQLAAQAKDAQASLQGALQTCRPEELDQATAAIDAFGKAVGAAADSRPPGTPENRADGPAAQANKPPDAAQVGAALMKFAQKAAGVIRADPSRAAGLTDMLTKAQTSFKAGDLAGTIIQMHGLRDTLGQGALGATAGRGETPNIVPPTGGTPDGHGAARELFTKLAAEWSNAEQNVRDGVQKLKVELDKLYDGDPAAASMEKDFQVHVDTIFSKFDGTLAKAVQAAVSAGTPVELAKTKADLRGSVSGFMSFLQHDSIALIDKNPLVALDLIGPCESTLGTMLSALN